MELPTVDSSSNDPLAVAADLHDASIAIPRQSISISDLAVLHSALDSTARKRLQVFERWLKSIPLGQHAEAIHASKLKSIRRKKGIVAMMLCFLGVAFESILKPPGGYRQGELPQAGDPIVGESYIKYGIASSLFLVVTALTYALSHLVLVPTYILNACTVTVCAGAIYIFLFQMAFQARGGFPGLWVVVFKVLPYVALAAIFVLWVGIFCCHLLKRTPVSDIEQFGGEEEIATDYK